MKYLFCGLGSVGQRHLSNLVSLGETDILAFRKTDNQLVKNGQIVKSYHSLSKALSQRPDAAFITNPSIFHMPYAIKLAKNNCHLFIEKPLSVASKGLTDLEKIVKKRKLQVMIGFVLRFHPAVEQIKKWLNEKVIGESISIRMSCAEFLPLWHPYEDYRSSYAGKKELGGGPIFTLCHEIDLVYYFFGKPESVYALISRPSTLNISTEHVVEILFQYKNHLIANVHLDYLQNPPQRQWQIIGDKGKIEFDYYKNELVLFKNKSRTLEYQTIKINYQNKFDRNDMFKNEVKSFISSLKNNNQVQIPLKDGIINTQILMAAHKSAKIGKKVVIEY